MRRLALLASLLALLPLIAHADDPSSVVTTDYDYRTAITITNNTGGVLSNQWLPITIDHATFDPFITQTDNDDFMFHSSADGALEFTYADGYAWGRADSLATGESTYYLYSGNSTVTHNYDLWLDASGDVISTPDHADLDIADDLDFQIRVNYPTWPSANSLIAQKESQYRIEADAGNTISGLLPVGTSTTNTLEVNGNGDVFGTRQPLETGCAAGAHWECVEVDSDGNYLSGNDGTGTWTDTFNIEDFTPNFAYITSVDILCSFSYEPGDTITVGLRLDGVSGTPVDAEAGGDCNSTTGLSKPGGGDWHASDIDDLQVIAYVVEDGTSSVADQWEYIAVQVTYNQAVEVTSGALSLNTDYTVNLLFDNGGSPEVDLQINTVSVDTSAATQTSLPATDSLFIVNLDGQGAFIDDITVDGGATEYLAWRFEQGNSGAPAIDITTQGTANNSWTWSGTLEDVSVGGSDHDGTVTLTRDMTDIFVKTGTLQIQDSPSTTATLATLGNALGDLGIDLTGTGTIATRFPFQTEVNQAADGAGIARSVGWLIVIGLLAFTVAWLIKLWVKNDVVAVIILLGIVVAGAANNLYAFGPAILLAMSLIGMLTILRAAKVGEV